MIDDIFKVVLDLSISASFLILIVLMLRPLAKARFAPKFRVYLWIMVIIKLILPFSFSTSFSAYNLLPDIKPTSYSSQDIDMSAINEADDNFIVTYDNNTISLDNSLHSIEENTNNDNTDTNTFSHSQTVSNIDNSIDSLTKTTNNDKPINTESKMNILSIIWLVGFAALLSVYTIINILFYYSLKDSYYMDETLSINAVFSNTEIQRETF